MIDGLGIYRSLNFAKGFSPEWIDLSITSERRLISA
jgi:hypothetical protein